MYNKKTAMFVLSLVFGCSTATVFSKEENKNKKITIKTAEQKMAKETFAKLMLLTIFLERLQLNKQQKKLAKDVTCKYLDGKELTSIIKELHFFETRKDSGKPTTCDDRLLKVEQPEKK